jgi:hypothetical protein
MPENETTNNQIPPATVPGTGQPEQGPGTAESAETGSGAESLADSRPSAPPIMVLPGQLPQRQAAGPAWLKGIWAILAAFVLVLVAILIFFTSRQPGKGVPAGRAGNEPNDQGNVDLRNYSAFVAQNRALLERGSEETILTDEAFAGQAPLATRAGGPLVSNETDPQLAALVDAFRIRVHVMQGSQSLVRNRTLTRITKGDLRGFKVLASERVEDGKVVAEEAQVLTPRNGLIRTVGRVLAVLQKTDLAGVLAEVKQAGMEFSPLPATADGKMFRAQLRFARPWGKAIPGELLIAGNGVGGLALGMPVSEIKNHLSATYGVLKRRILVNDVNYDVFKIMDPVGEPLFFVYEKDGLVWGISIISAAFTTQQGIGINSSLDQIRLHYPLVKLAYSGKKTPFVRLEGTAGIFIFQGGGDKKVISILIGESPEFE